MSADAQRFTEKEWTDRLRVRERKERMGAAQQQREEDEARKDHERTDLTDEELAKAADHHFNVEQWSCSGCWHGHICTTGRLIREVMRWREGGSAS